MSGKKNNRTDQSREKKQTVKDPFLERIKVQRTILKKMLREIDPPSEQEEGLKPGNPDE